MNKSGAPALRIVLYPAMGTARTVAHALATVVALAAVLRLGSIAAWWMLPLWYLATFVGVHVVLVPVMTAWRAFLESADRYIRSVVEEELIRFDLQTCERQLARLMPDRGERVD